MWTLFLYLAITIIGYFIGSAARKRGHMLEFVGTVQTIAIMVLVFTMGSRIGSNEDIVAGLGTIGVTAFIFTVFTLGCSVLAVFFMRKLLGFDRYGERKMRQRGQSPLSQNDTECSQGDGFGGNNVPTGSDPMGQAVDNSESEEKKRGLNTLTFIIIGAVTVGILAGYFIMPQWFIDISGTLLTLFLCLLLITVGLDLGREGTVVQNFKAAGWRVLVTPFVVMFGTYAGGAIASLFLPIGFQDSLCIGSGFAWYSLAPVMLMDYSVKVSAISFMHNVMREIFAVLLIPVVARRIGYIEAVALPASPSMDICLPIVERATSPNTAIYSFISGVVLSAAVPIMTSLFMAI